MPFMHGSYLKQPQPPKFVLTVGNLPLMIFSKQGVSCHVHVFQLLLSQLQVTDAALWQ